MSAGQADDTAAVPQRFGPWWIALICAAVSFALAAGFLPQQSLWVDETTQLTGLSLGLGDLIAWLAGAEPGRFGLPDDRMPPLSYVLGWIWSRLFGLTEVSLRWMSACVTALAAAVVSRTGGLLGGTRSAWLAGMLFGLSPNVIVTSVEIRAYPLFFLTSAAALFAFVRVVQAPSEPSARQVITLTLAILSAVYTHFFGVVLAAGLWLSSGWIVFRRGASIRLLVIGCATSAVASLGLAPFALASLGMSKEPQQVDVLRDFARLLYRLFSHVALATQPIVEGLTAIGFAVLLYLAVFHARKQAPAMWSLLLALACGLAVTGVAGVVIRGFKAYSPSYNDWALPLLCVLLSCAGIGASPRWQRIATVSSMVTCAGLAYGAFMIETHGEAFSHGSHLRLLSNIHRLGGALRVTVIHEPTLTDAYFPLFYDTRGTALQFAARPEDPGHIARITPSGYGDPISLDRIATPHAIVVQTHWESARDIKQGLNGAPVAFDPSRAARELLAAGWRQVGSERVIATAGATIQTFSR